MVFDSFISHQGNACGPCICPHPLGESTMNAYICRLWIKYYKSWIFLGPSVVQHSPHIPPSYMSLFPLFNQINYDRSWSLYFVHLSGWFVLSGGGREEVRLIFLVVIYTCRYTFREALSDPRMWLWIKRQKLTFVAIQDTHTYIYVYICNVT